MTEEECIERIMREIKQLERELAFLRSHPKHDKNVYQALDRSDVIQQKIDDLRNTLDNF